MATTHAATVYPVTVADAWPTPPRSTPAVAPQPAPTEPEAGSDRSVSSAAATALSLDLPEELSGHDLLETAVRCASPVMVVVDAEAAVHTGGLPELLWSFQPQTTLAPLTVAEIPTRGASYQRQRSVAERTGHDLVAVVDSVVREL